MARWHSCNVLHGGAGARQLWQFAADGGQFKLGRELAGPSDALLPARLVGKGWRDLFQRKLNVAWLPPESVFLRVARFPQSTFDETLAMVELQLEKLSPIPITQVVWSLHVLPNPAPGPKPPPVPKAPANPGEKAAPQEIRDMQTVIVTLAERKAVEEFLGQLEGQGYMADRLEVPALDQLMATHVQEDGAWIYPAVCGGANAALVAWWYGGVLQNLNLIALPAEGDRAASLRQQLVQTAWAGEMEGWLTAPPTWHLVAAPPAATEWEPALRQGLNEPVLVTPQVAPAELAALTAKRAAQTETKSNLLPTEFATRYQQQFVDRVWMRGLVAAGGVYLVAVALYLGAVQVLAFQTRRVEATLQSVSLAYTNALQLRDQYNVLKERQDLKYAGLDCWYVAAEKLPERFRLEHISLKDGRQLILNGTAPSDSVNELYDFHEKMRRAVVRDQPLFDPSSGDQIPKWSRNPGANDISWNFALDLKHTETP